MSFTELKIITLNAWSIPLPGFTKERATRVAAIAEYLASTQYDIITLQEIWSKDDFSQICVAVQSSMPYSHYFYSGMIGSGVCVISRHPILQTFHHRFQINGYAHKVHHGDWFGGKVIGLCRIQVHDYIVNVYSAHLHGKYHEISDGYNSHRLAQACQLSQFVKMTSEGCDAVIMMGDFNLEPKDLGYKVIVANANVKDAWLNQKQDVLNECEPTCVRPDNSFTVNKDGGEGMRLDYIFYRNNAGIDLRCERCNLTMQKIPGTDINYSDHEGLEAVLTLRRSVTAMAQARDTKSIEVHLTEAIPVLRDAMDAVKATRVFYTVLLTLTLLLFIAVSSTPLVFVLQFIVNIALVVVMSYSLWSVVVLSSNELNAFKATLLDINHTLKSNPTM